MKAMSAHEDIVAQLQKRIEHLEAEVESMYHVKNCYRRIQQLLAESQGAIDKSQEVLPRGHH
jgi:chaperonin cofactor prefoldin